MFVKEQRVDDYKCLKYSFKCLRCTLRGLINKFSLRLYAKNNYDSPLIGINSFSVNSCRSFSTLNNNEHKPLSPRGSELKPDPWFITGFTDAEGCFTCSILKSSGYKLGW